MSFFKSPYGTDRRVPVLYLWGRDCGYEAYYDEAIVQFAKQEARLQGVLEEIEKRGMTERDLIGLLADLVVRLDSALVESSNSYLDLLYKSTQLEEQAIKLSKLSKAVLEEWRKK